MNIPNEINAENFLKRIDIGEMAKLGYPMSTIRSMSDAEVDRLLTSGERFTSYTFEKAKKKDFSQRVHKSLIRGPRKPRPDTNVFMVRSERIRKTEEYVHPENIITDNLTSIPDTKTQHKITTQEQQTPTQQIKERIDQTTQRQAAAKGAREIKNPVVSEAKVKAQIKAANAEAFKRRRVYLDYPTGHPNTKLYEKIATQQEGSAKVLRELKESLFLRERVKGTRKVIELTAGPKDMPKEYFTWYAKKIRKIGIQRQKLIDRSARAVRNAKPAAPIRGAGWKQFEKDISGIYNETKRSFTAIASNAKLASTAKALYNNKFLRGTATTVAVMAAFNISMNIIRKSFFSKPAIPEEYERGYDIMAETLTDFGSPLSLASAAHKVMKPYYSTVRSALKTDVNAIINRNAALKAAKTAIGHTRY